MARAFRTRIVRSGDSYGIRIRNILLEQTGLQEDVTLVVREGNIIVRAARPARYGWEEAFKTMAARGDDALLEGDVAPSLTWDEEEWEW